MFLWTDLETTGLVNYSDLPLAVGIVLTDNEFRERARGEWVIGWDLGDIRATCMDPFVEAMHTKSGLLARVLDPATPPLGAVEAQIAEWLRAQGLNDTTEIKKRPPYAGNSVAFDRGFIDEYMPRVAAFYNYRCLDVSTLKVIAQAIAPGAREWCAAKEGQAVHTPLKDIDASLREFAHWRRELFKPEVGCCPYFAVTHAGPALTGGVPSTYEPCTLTPGHMPPCKP